MTMNTWEQQFKKLGLPTQKVELWKYTSLNNFIDTNELTNPKVQTHSLHEKNITLPESFQTQIISFNGLKWCTSSTEIVQSNEVNDQYQTKQLINLDGMYNLHRSIKSQSIFKIKKCRTLCIYLPLASSTQDIPELFLDLSLHQGDLTIYEYQNNVNNFSATNIYSISIVNKQSKLHYHRICQSQNSKSISWLQITNSADTLVHLWHQKNQKSKDYISINNISTSAKNEITLVANLNSDAHLDITTQVNHLVPTTTSLQNFKVILDDHALCALTGKIFIEKNCHETASFLKSKHTLLSDKCHLHSQPQLEIYADDVECAHGSSTGKLQDEEYFYLCSRGLTPEKAKKLLLRAFIMEQIEQLETAEQKNFFQELVL